MSAVKSKKKQQGLSLIEKLDLIAEYEKTGKKHVVLAREFALPRSSVSTILRQKELYKERFWEDQFNVNRKRVRTAFHDDIDEHLFRWVRQAQASNLQISGPVLMSQANHIARKLGKMDWKCSAGWMDRFKKRYNILFNRKHYLILKKHLKNTVFKQPQNTVSVQDNSESNALSRREPDTNNVFEKHCNTNIRQEIVESGTDNNALVEQWRERVEQWKSSVLNPALAKYKPRDVYSATEFGLFWKLIPDMAPVFKNEKCYNGQKAEDRITVLICANAEGNDKIPLFVIGKFQRAFKKLKILPVRYRANSNAWMTSELFASWLSEFDEKMAVQQRKVLLIVDESAVHPSDLNLKATELVFLPSSSRDSLWTDTSSAKLQPLKLGIISSLKAHYRSGLLAMLIDHLDVGLAYEDFSVTFLDAVTLLKTAWQKVSQETVEKCFAEAGFVSFTALLIAHLRHSKEKNPYSLSQRIPRGPQERNFDDFHERGHSNLKERDLCDFQERTIYDTQDGEICDAVEVKYSDSKEWALSVSQERNNNVPQNRDINDFYEMKYSDSRRGNTTDLQDRKYDLQAWDLGDCLERKYGSKESDPNDFQRSNIIDPQEYHNNFQGMKYDVCKEWYTVDSYERINIQMQLMRLSREVEGLTLSVQEFISADDNLTVFAPTPVDVAVTVDGAHIKTEIQSPTQLGDDNDNQDDNDVDDDDKNPAPSIAIITLAEAKKCLETLSLYQCQAGCGETLAIKFSEFQREFERVHTHWQSSATVSECVTAVAKAKTASDLRHHAVTHLNKSQCNKMLKGYHQLRQHYTKEHQDQVKKNKYECHICSKRFSRGTYLTVHLRDEHRYRWPSGHRRFRYKLHPDGIRRLQTIRYESIEVSQQVLGQTLSPDSGSPSSALMMAEDELEEDGGENELARTEIEVIHETDEQATAGNGQLTDLTGRNKAEATDAQDEQLRKSAMGHKSDPSLGSKGQKFVERKTGRSRGKRKQEELEEGCDSNSLTNSNHMQGGNQGGRSKRSRKKTSLNTDNADPQIEIDMAHQNGEESLTTSDISEISSAYSIQQMQPNSHSPWSVSAQSQFSVMSSSAGSVYPEETGSDTFSTSFISSSVGTAAFTPRTTDFSPSTIGTESQTGDASHGSSASFCVVGSVEVNTEKHLQHWQNMDSLLRAGGESASELQDTPPLKMDSRDLAGEEYAHNVFQIQQSSNMNIKNLSGQSYPTEMQTQILSSSSVDLQDTVRAEATQSLSNLDVCQSWFGSGLHSPGQTFPSGLSHQLDTTSPLSSSLTTDIGASTAKVLTTTTSIPFPASLLFSCSTSPAKQELHHVPLVTTALDIGLHTPEKQAITWTLPTFGISPVKPEPGISTCVPVSSAAQDISTCQLEEEGFNQGELILRWGSQSNSQSPSFNCSSGINSDTQSLMLDSNMDTTKFQTEGASGLLSTSQENQSAQEQITTKTKSDSSRSISTLPPSLYLIDNYHVTSDSEGVATVSFECQPQEVANSTKDDLNNITSLHSSRSACVVPVGPDAEGNGHSVTVAISQTGPSPVKIEPEPEHCTPVTDGPEERGIGRERRSVQFTDGTKAKEVFDDVNSTVTGQLHSDFDAAIQNGEMDECAAKTADDGEGNGPGVMLIPEGSSDDTVSLHQLYNLQMLGEVALSGQTQKK